MEKQGGAWRKGGRDSATPKSKQSRQQQRPNLFDKKMDPAFEEYWSKERVQQGLKRGELIQGELRINQKNYEEAFINDPEGGPDYFIQGMLRRNRTFQSDVVVVHVLPQDQWMLEDQTTTKDPPASDCAGGGMKDTAESLAGLSLGDSLPSSTTEDATNPQSGPVRETLIDVLYSVPAGAKAEAESSKVPLGKEVYKYRRTAKVVYIIDKGHSRACAGILKAFDREKGLALLSPKDSKIPRIVLPLADCPEDYCRNPKKYEATLFVCRIQQWPADSPFSLGTLLRSLGEAGEIEPESEAYLLENKVDFEDFSPAVLDCLPKDLPWTIPQEEETKRRDFRKECVFSIDPATARDLDDALHVKKLDEGVFELGVHIADVSYFVQPGAPLDGIASQRATSVYLVQKVIPMLPRLLCEQLCSLNPDEERLTFSVVWTMTGKGEFLSEWMGRSMIRSCAKLSYDHAQLMIDEPQREWQDGDLPPISGGYSIAQVTEAVNSLNKLATALRVQRQAKGTLRLNQPKLTFPLDKDTGLPNGCSVYQQKESNRLIEEFMLLANMAVARRIHKSFPDHAMLRRHPTPKGKPAEALAAKCATLGIQFDFGSAAAIQQSLNQYRGRTDNEEITKMEKSIMINFCSKIMELARYFCTGTVEKESRYVHYALNVPRYTHFTSPIRRYADIVVHRQLAHVLGEGPAFTLTTDEVEVQADHCNKKKKSAKVVEELSGQLFFSIFLRECGPLTEKGMVMGVLDRAFDVMVMKYGVIKRVYCEKLPLKGYQFILKGNKKIPHLTLEWADNNRTTQDMTLFTPVEVVLSGCQKSLQYEATVTAPKSQEN